MDVETLAHRRKTGLENLKGFVLTQWPIRQSMPSEKVALCIENCLKWLEGTDLDPREHFNSAIKAAGVTHAQLGQAIAKQFRVATAQGERGVEAGDAVPVPFAAPYLVQPEDVIASSPLPQAVLQPSH